MALVVGGREQLGIEAFAEALELLANINAPSSSKCNPDISLLHGGILDDTNARANSPGLRKWLARQGASRWQLINVYFLTGALWVVGILATILGVFENPH